MANQVSVTIGVPVLFDGTSTTVTFDLATSPYCITSGEPNGPFAGVIGQQVNWFTTTPLAKQPTGIISPSGGYTATLSGTVVTLTYSTAPAAGGQEVQVFLLF